MVLEEILQDIKSISIRNARKLHDIFMNMSDCYSSGQDRGILEDIMSIFIRNAMKLHDIFTNMSDCYWALVNRSSMSSTLLPGSAFPRRQAHSARPGVTCHKRSPPVDRVTAIDWNYDRTLQWQVQLAGCFSSVLDWLWSSPAYGCPQQRLNIRKTVSHLKLWS